MRTNVQWSLMAVAVDGFIKFRNAAVDLTVKQQGTGGRIEISS